MGGRSRLWAEPLQLDFLAEEALAGVAAVDVGVIEGGDAGLEAPPGEIQSMRFLKM